MGVEEVNSENKGHCQQSLIRVNDGCYIDYPSRQEAGEEFREPQHQSGGADNGDTPENCEIIEFFPVGPASIAGPRAASEEPFEGGDSVTDIFAIRHHRVRPENHLPPCFILAAFHPEDIIYMSEEVAESYDGTDTVDVTSRFETAKNLGYPLSPCQV